MVSTAGLSKKPGLSERMEKLGALTRHLKSLVARSAVRRPAYRMLVARSLVYLLPGLGLILLATESYVTGGLLVLATPLAAAILLFYDVGQRGRMSYHVARYARSEPDDPAGADDAISGKRWKLVFLGVAEWMERKLQSDDDDRGLLGKLIAGVVGELLDVAGAFLLPAVVLDDVSIEEAVQKVKDLKDHAPEAFVASVGFDAVASLLSSFFWAPVVIVPLAAVGGVVAGLLTIPQATGVAAAMALLLAVPLAAVHTLQEAAKAAYFTALYLLVTHPEEVAGERAASLESLVQMSDPEATPEPVAGTA